MRPAAILMGVVLMGATLASAQNLSVIKQRQELFEGMGKATKGPGGMLKGTVPYDGAAVAAALDTYIDAAGKLPALFPDDSKTGGKTAALPGIWTSKDDFNARFAKLGRDAEAAKAAITDEASFKAAFPKVVSNCGGCHKEYRAKNG